jgi:hypothetical protein
MCTLNGQVAAGIRSWFKSCKNAKKSASEREIATYADPEDLSAMFRFDRGEAHGGLCDKFVMLT